ncbi:MAG: hypothetical protein ACKN92_09595, partial [Candidatus Nanopelagicaceae bacterium]
MFWIQIIIPLTLALSGLVILYSDSREHKAFIQNSYAHARQQLVEIGERQADKTLIKERLVEIGKASESAYGEFRYMQLVITAGASLLPFIGYFLMIVDFIQALSLSIFLGIGAYLIYDHHLSSLVKERRDLVESEFPPIVEMLTLAIAAGETPVSAFARIADRSDSYLSREFALVIQQVRKGRPF